MKSTDGIERIRHGDEGVSFALIREIAEVEIIAQFRVNGEPVSKARARFTGYGSKSRAYTPEKTKTAEQKIAWLFRQAAPHHQPDKESTYGVMAVFFNDTRQRRDVDNMLKLVCDGLNGVAWHDDVQVEEVAGRRGYDVDGNARTEILIYRIDKVRRPEKACEHCGTSFPVYRSTEMARRFCSRPCDVEFRRIARTHTCAHCAREFERKGVPKYCSMECKSLATTVEVTCAGCATQFRRPQSQVVGATQWCTRECRNRQAAT